MTSLNTVWLLICGTLVFFMQAGFAMLETGFTRAKNAGNIVMKNIIDICIGAPVFFFIGFGLMFGKNCGFIGNLDLLTIHPFYLTGYLFAASYFIRLPSVLRQQQLFPGQWQKELNFRHIAYTA